jgi:hypothetical protein
MVAIIALSLYALIHWRACPKEAKSPFDLISFAFGIFLAGAVLISYQWWNFGHPFYPAQHYMPDVAYTDQGYRGFSWPQLDLLWQTAFGIRYGLFTSAPILLLFFYIPGWYRKNIRLISGPELQFVIIFIISYFLFCAANQYGRIQFNTGVRHIVPVIPFLFLLVAAVYVQMPKILAIPVGIVSIYWSWCLAMYRDVEFGRGIFESLIHISTKGPMIPWLKTLERMGYISSTLPTILLILFLAVAIWLLWAVGKPFAKESSV